MQSILCVAPCYPKGSLVPNKRKEHHFCGALLTERTVLAGCSIVLKKEKKKRKKPAVFLVDKLAGPLCGPDWTTVWS